MKQKKKTVSCRFLAYGLHREQSDVREYVHKSDDFELLDVPLGSQHSFTDFDGVILFGGAFERIVQENWGGHSNACLNRTLLDKCELQAQQLLHLGKALIVLLDEIPGLHHRAVRIDPNHDLFRRLAKGLVHYISIEKAVHPLKAIHHELCNICVTLGRDT